MVSRENIRTISVIIVVNNLPRNQRVRRPSKKPYKRKHSETDPYELIGILKERLRLAKKEAKLYNRLTEKLWLYLLKVDTVPTELKTKLLSKFSQEESRALLDIIEAKEDPQIDTSFYSKRVIEKELKL